MEASVLSVSKWGGNGGLTQMTVGLGTGAEVPCLDKTSGLDLSQRQLSLPAALRGSSDLCVKHDAGSSSSQSVQPLHELL